MRSSDPAIQEHIDQGHYCALLAGMWLHCESSYPAILLRSHVGIDGNSYYVYSQEERSALKTLLESGELDQDAAAELQLALADQDHQAITEFGLGRVRHFFPGVVPISKWERDIVENGYSECYSFGMCWGASWNRAILEALLLFEEHQNCYPCLCLRPGPFTECQFLLDLLQSLELIKYGLVDGIYIIDDMKLEKLGGQEGLRLFGQVIDVLFGSHLDDLGNSKLSQILQHGVQTIWPDLDPIQDQDPAAVATAFLMVGLS